jgi:hypothetical protein
VQVINERSKLRVFIEKQTNEPLQGPVPIGYQNALVSFWVTEPFPPDQLPFLADIPIEVFIPQNTPVRLPPAIGMQFGNGIGISGLGKPIGYHGSV